MVTFRWQRPKSSGDRVAHISSNLLLYEYEVSGFHARYCLGRLVIYPHLIQLNQIQSPWRRDQRFPPKHRCKNSKDHNVSLYSVAFACINLVNTRIFTLKLPGLVTRVLAGRPGFDSKQGQGGFDSSQRLRQLWGPPQPLIQWVPESPPLDTKRPICTVHA
jgi:hypothetical protein